MQKEPIYPIYEATADGKVVGASEMLGNVFNQVGKALERGADEVVIRRTNKVVDARVPGHA